MTWYWTPTVVVACLALGFWLWLWRWDRKYPAFPPRPVTPLDRATRVAYEMKR